MLKNADKLLMEIIDYAEAKEGFKLCTKNIHQGRPIGFVLYEYLIPNYMYLFITRPDGGEPFAIKTNDKAANPEFPPGVLSAIPLTEDQNIVVIKREDESTYIAEIYKVDYSSVKEVRLKLLQKGNVRSISRPSLKSVTEGVEKLKLEMIPHWEQHIKKHSHNPSRKVETILMFNPNPKNSSVMKGYRRDGKMVELTNATKDLVISEESMLPDVAVFRVFYYKKYSDSPRKFVSGVKMDHVTLDNLSDYIPHCDVGEENIVQIRLINGQSLLGVSIGNTIYVLYKHLTGYKSFPLSEIELEKVVERITSVK